jgi:hypothetical protein
MSKFDLEVKGEGQLVKMISKAPSKGYVYLFFSGKKPQ